MTKPHKWHKEIKAWADGAEIEYWNDERETWSSIFVGSQPRWYEDVKYRIKPQPMPKGFPANKTPTGIKEPQYLYVYQSYEETTFGDIKIISQKRTPINATCIGKIKLED